MSTAVTAATAEATMPALPALHQAAKDGNVEELQRIVGDPAASTDVNLQAEDGSYAIQWAVSSNSWQATQFLLEQRADPTLLGPMDSTALHWAVRGGLVYTAHLLIQAGADPMAPDSQLFTPLHVAVHSSNVLMVIYLLHLEYPCDANAPDGSGKTPLHWAAYQGDHLSVSALLRAGADPNLRDKEGFIPLHWSIVSRSRSCMQLLLAAGSDLSIKNNSDRSIADMLEDMNSRPEWLDATLLANRTEDGSLVHRPLSKGKANFVLFVLPGVLCPLLILLLEQWITVPLALLVAYLAKVVCDRVLYPCVQPGPGALIRSTVLAGIYNGMFFWIMVAYLWFVMPVTRAAHPVLSLLLPVLAAITLVFYVCCAIQDPGQIRAGSIAERRDAIYGLIEQGYYDANHFCVETWARKPMRSHYSRHANAVIARFDHYCPWVYNAVGLRNHRAFMLYLTTLSAALVLYFYLYTEFLAGQSLSDNLFVAFMTAGIFVQACWILLLTLTQYVQIARGMTTHEFQHTAGNPFSSLPRDHPAAPRVPPPPPPEHSEPAAPPALHAQRSSLGTCLKLLGVQQAIQTSHELRKTRRPNYGVCTNCGDFWCTGWNVFRPTGAGRLNGLPVDYRTQMDTGASVRRQGAAGTLASIV